MRFRGQFIRLSDEIIVAADKRRRGIGGVLAADKSINQRLRLDFAQICINVCSFLNPRH